MRKEAPKVMSGMRKKFQRVSRMLTAAALALAMVLSMTGIKARAAVSYQADLAIRGTVKFSGASNNEAPRAEFRLTGTDGAPMPEADSVAVDLTGEEEKEFSFDHVTYTSPGTYRYQVKQTVISSGYRMDTTVYDITVFATYEDGFLTAVMYANREGDTGSKTEIRFINTKESGELPNTGGDEDPTPKPEDPKPTPKPEDPKPTPQPENPKPTPQPENPKPTPAVKPTERPGVVTAIRRATVPSVVRTISNAVKTGDTSSVALWSIIAAVAVIGTIVIAGKRKNHNKK